MNPKTPKTSWTSEHPRKTSSSAHAPAPTPEKVSASFSELDISEPIINAITELGYEVPSPIQAETLPILLGEETDFIGLAATGTGKTAAFGIPMLEKIDPKRKRVQGLILCPTRELAIQVTKHIELIGKYKGIQAVTVYGGSSYRDQILGIKHGASVVVGTPGRIIDLLEHKSLSLADVATVVLDEADEMISMGFKEDLEKILDNVPEESNTWLFTATMEHEVRKVADEYLDSPKSVHINRKEMLSNTVEQIYYSLHESDKPEVLCKLIDAAEDFYGLVFCQTKLLVVDLMRYLSSRGYKVDCLHGDMEQKARERTMQAFRNKEVSLLICTDVASRGLDVKDLTHVINYSIPRELEHYVHRIGRTARVGKPGIAMSLVTPSHRELIGRIERMTNSKMIHGKIPTRRDIGTKKISKYLEQFQAQQHFSRAVELLTAEWKEAISTMTQEEIAGRFVSLIFPEVFSNPLQMQRPAVHCQEEPQPLRNRSRRDHNNRGSRRDQQNRRFSQGRSSDGRHSSGNRGGNRGKPMHRGQREQN